MKTKENAFTSNSLRNSPFPFSFTIKEKITYEAYGYPIGIRDIIDTLLASLKEYLIVFDIDTNDYKKLPDGNYTNYSLVEIADSLSIHYRRFDKEIIELNKENFGRLIKSIDHYNLHFFDTPDESDIEKVTDWYLKYANSQEKTFQYLPTLPSSSMYIDSHDDCYLYLESRSIRPVLNIIQTSLKTFAQVMIERFLKTETIPELPNIELVKALNERNGTFLILPQEITMEDSFLKLPLSFSEYDFIHQKEYSKDAILTYDSRKAEWRIEFNHE